MEYGQRETGRIKVEMSRLTDGRSPPLRADTPRGISIQDACLAPTLLHRTVGTGGSSVECHHRPGSTPKLQALSTE
jgi:hypothetical protein